MFGGFGVVNEKLFCCDKLCGWFVVSPLCGILKPLFGGVVIFRSVCIANSGSIKPTCAFNFSNTSPCWRFGKFDTFIKLPSILNAWLGTNGWWLWLVNEKCSRIFFLFEINTILFFYIFLFASIFRKTKLTCLLYLMVDVLDCVQNLKPHFHLYAHSN